MGCSCLKPTNNISESTTISKINMPSKQNPNDFLDRAKGCILGAFLGDSIGSYLELKSFIHKDLLKEALDMPGGGPFILSPGQVTDDSELAICLLNGLVEGNGLFSLEKIALNYQKWMLSPPFDIGTTTTKSLSELTKHKSQPIKNLGRLCQEAARKYNGSSKSNGGIMRITPLAVWSSKLDSLDDVEKVIIEENSITHSNPLEQKAAISYCLAIRYLILNHGDVEGTLKHVENWITNKGDEELNQWWMMVKKKEWMGAISNMGFVKIAWTYSFIVLQEPNLNFLNVMEKVLARGGDTDTNACIVGGLIGAKLGFAKLKQQAPTQCQKLLDLDVSTARRKRPSMFSPGKVFYLIDKLVEIAPQELKFEE